MMKKNSIKKRALFMALVVVLGFLASSLMVSSTYASYFSDHENDSPESNLRMEMYYEAVKKCLSSSKSSTATINLSNRSEANRDKAYYYYGLNADRLFDNGSGSGDSNLLYSEILESEVAGGRQDGKLYCSELGGALPDLLKNLGLYDEGNMSKLLCNGSEPGIFKITAGYGYSTARFTNNYGDWPSGLADPENGADCGANLALFLEYARDPSNNATILGSGNGTNGYPFNIKFEIADNAADYFENFVEPYLGSPRNRSLMDEWKYYKTFNTGCVEIASGQTEVPPESSNMVGIYDLRSRQVHYHNLNQIKKDEQRYIGVDDKEQMTCGELAEKLGADLTNGGVKQSRINRLVRDNNRRAIEECVNKYLNALGEYGKYGNEYASTVEAGEDFARMAERVLNAIENGGSLATIDDEVMTGVPYKDQFIAKFDSYYSSAMSGIGGQSIYSSEMTNNYLPKIRDRVLEYLNASEISEDGRVVSTSVSADMIPTARGLLTRFQRETNDVKENSSKVDDFLRNKASEIEYDENWFTKLWGGEQGELEIDYNALEGKVWDIEDGDVICHGLQDLKDDFEEMGLVNMPDIDTSFNSDDYQGGEGSTGEFDSDGNECYNSGLEGISWIVCPAINNMAAATDGILRNKLDKWLSVDSDWYGMLSEDGEQSHVKDVWENFRTVANVLMIIMLIVVIISQVTGYGIDNYGIKKILPRLIIVSILINLSFFICQIAIDLSNIVGNGLNDMFQSFGRSTFDGGTPIIQSAVAILFAAVSGVGAVSGFAFTVASFAIGGGGGIMIALSLLLAVGIAFISVMLFFMTIAARSIIVIVFIAIAPVAFACYVLPNTQNLFKKWWDIFKAALLVYPICGALYGMGSVVRGIIIGGSGEKQWWMVLMAIFVPFLPFLVMPSLLKGVLAMLGKLGGTLSTLGTGAKRGFMMGNAALQRSEAYKDAQKRAQRNITAWRAGAKFAKGGRRTGELRKKDGKVEFNEPKGLGRFLRGGERGVNLARQQVSRDQAERASEEIASSSRGISASMAGAEAEAEAKWDRNAEALLGFGRATYDTKENGRVVTKTVEPGDTKSVAAYHAASMEKYQEAKNSGDEKKMREVLSDIRAAQKVLSRSGGGRDEVEKNLKNAVAKGYGDSAKEAAQHLQSNYGDLYKSKNRSTDALINHLAGGVEMEKINKNIESGAYDLVGADKYDQASLVGADDGALDDLVKGASDVRARIEAGEPIDSDEQKRYDQIRGTATKAIEMYDNGRLSVKPEVLSRVEEIAGVKSKSGVGSAPRENRAPESGSKPGGGGAPAPAPGAGGMPRGGSDGIFGNGEVFNVRQGGNSGRTTTPVNNDVFSTGKNQVTEGGIILPNEEQIRVTHTREVRADAPIRDFGKIFRNDNQNNNNLGGNNSGNNPSENNASNNPSENNASNN